MSEVKEKSKELIIHITSGNLKELFDSATEALALLDIVSVVCFNGSKVELEPAERLRKSIQKVRSEGL